MPPNDVQHYDHFICCRNLKTTIASTEDHNKTTTETDKMMYLYTVMDGSLYVSTDMKEKMEN